MQIDKTRLETDTQAAASATEGSPAGTKAEPGGAGEPTGPGAAADTGGSCEGSGSVDGQMGPGAAGLGERPFLEAMAPSQRDRFARALTEDESVGPDIVTMARMLGIWCADHHAEDQRAPLRSAAVELGAFPADKIPRLCPECAAHERYAEIRRALCPKSPRPSCRDCDVHCYTAEESNWQRDAMAYAGPRAMFRGLARESLHHLWQGLTVGRKQDKAKRARRDKSRGQDY